MGNLPPAAPSSSVNQTGRDCSLEQYDSNDYCLTEAEYISDILYEMRLTPFKIGLLCLYATVFAVGLLGNLLVIIAILRTPQMRTATNLFLLNLALADFFVILFCLVPTVVEDFMETWVFGGVACRVLKYLQPISVTVSVLTLTFNSVERLLAICFPLTFKTTKRRICNLIMMIWTVALVSNLHYPFKMETEPFAALPKDQTLLTQCRSTWGPKLHYTNVSSGNVTGQSGPTMNISAAIDPDTVAKVVDSVLFFVLPLAWMLVAYTMICRRLWYSAVPGETARSAGQQSSANRTGDATLKQRRRTALMLIAIVLIFFLCYLPVHILRAA